MVWLSLIGLIAPPAPSISIGPAASSRAGRQTVKIASTVRARPSNAAA